jgi:beta-xylosidase
MVVPRGFYLSTDDIFKHDSFSEPIWLENAGIDQDVSQSLGSIEASSNDNISFGSF